MMNQFEFVEVAHEKMMFSSMKTPLPQADIFQWWPQHWKIRILLHEMNIRQVIMVNNMLNRF